MLDNQTEPLYPENGHSNGTIASAIESINELDADAQKQLAGLSDSELLIPNEYVINSDSPQAEKSNNNPTAKAGFVLIFIGGVMGILAFVWFFLLAPKPSTKQVKVEPKPTTTPQISSDENARLKSQLAFQDQKRDLVTPKERQPVVTPDTPNKPTTKTVSRPLRRTPAPAPVRTPAPRLVTVPAPPAPAPVRTPAPRLVTIPAPAPVPTQSSANTIDPFERWSQLASLGQNRAENINIVDSSGNSTDSPTVSSPTESEFSNSNPAPNLPAPNLVQPVAREQTTLVSDTQLQNVVIGTAESVADTSPGTQGILSRTPSTNPDKTGQPLNLTDPLCSDRSSNEGCPVLSRFIEPQPQTQQQTQKTIIPGTIVAAKVAMPMIWDMGSRTRGQNKLLQQFTVEMTESLLAEDSSVALPAGTVFVAQVNSVNDKSNVVSASAIAVIYRDTSGTLRQEALPEGAILIRGEGGGALISKSLHNPRGAIARQDMWIATLNGLSKIGETINRPRIQTITTNFGFSQTTTQSDPQVWAAALEGVFGVTVDRFKKRSDQLIQELQRNPNVKVLPAESSASVVVSSFFQVRP